MEDGGCTRATDREKASAFNRTYAMVSKKVHDKKADRAAKARLKAPDVRSCRDWRGRGVTTLRHLRRRSLPTKSPKPVAEGPGSR